MNFASKEQNKNILIVYDNVENYDIFIKQIINLNKKIKIIVTLRSIDLNLQGASESYIQIEVKAFEENEFKDYVKYWNKRQNRQISEENILKLWKLVNDNFENKAIIYNVNKLLQTFFSERGDFDIRFKKLENKIFINIEYFETFY